MWCFDFEFLDWICDYTREIPSSKVCDYESDCDDGSDEFGCECK